MSSSPWPLLVVVVGVWEWVGFNWSTFRCEVVAAVVGAFFVYMATVQNQVEKVEMNCALC